MDLKVSKSKNAITYLLSGFSFNSFDICSLALVLFNRPVRVSWVA